MIILHGENIVKSREALIELILKAKKYKKEIIRLDGQKATLTDVIQSLESQSLFGSTKLIVIENLLSRKDKEVKKIIAYLQKNSTEEIIWWEPKLLTPSLQKKFPAAQNSTFKINPLIFKFLESLRPKNNLQSVKLLKECQKQDSPEMIFYMLCRQIRLLIQVKDKKSQRDLKMAPWQMAKLCSQAKSFSKEKLLSYYQELLKIDYQQKTGQDAFHLSSRLDLFIAQL